jgi:NAD(P)H-hydrate epimerase
MMVDKRILRMIYRKRELWCHKYHFGNLLVIGGSKLYSGSPAFNALAALRAGVDMVTILAPARAANIISSFSPDLIAYPLEGDYLSKGHLKEILKFIKGKTALVIGGGLCREEEILDGVVEILKKVKIPCVIDADAIHAVAHHREVIKKNFVLTPHAYEFYVLSKIKVEPILDKRVQEVKELAGIIGATILLKGHYDVISDGERVAVNRTGSPYMTAGGMGDTLAGICGALLARGVDPFEAACAAAYINGKAGELAARKWGESTIASDLLREIPQAIKQALG